MKLILCARCLCIKGQRARGLCKACYEWCRRHNDHYPSQAGAIGRGRVEDYFELLPVYGDAFQAIAARLRVKPATLDANLRRAGYRVVRNEPGTGRRVFGRA